MVKRNWIGQTINVGDKVYKAGYSGSSMYYMVGEVISSNPRTDRISVNWKVNQGTIWGPKINPQSQYGGKHRFEGPSGKHAGTTTVKSVGVYKLSDAEFDKIVLAGEIFDDLAEKIEKGYFQPQNQDQFYTELDRRYAHARVE